MTTLRLHRPLPPPPPDRGRRMWPEEVADLVGWTRATVLRKFPHPVKVSRKSIFFWEHDVRAFLETRRQAT